MDNKRQIKRVGNYSTRRGICWQWGYFSAGTAPRSPLIKNGSRGSVKESRVDDGGLASPRTRRGRTNRRSYFRLTIILFFLCRVKKKRSHQGVVLIDSPYFPCIIILIIIIKIGCTPTLTAIIFTTPLFRFVNYWWVCNRSRGTRLDLKNVIFSIK